jgi:tetratricopeptide (TPR) repeat protein
MMKVSKAIAAFAITGVLFVSCGPNANQIRRTQQLEEGVSNPTSIAELTDAIGKYQGRVEDIINAEIRIGTWYKILGTRYLDNKMYDKALETFRTAIEYYPMNQNLYYYVGVCAGYMAKSALDYEGTGKHIDRDSYYALAESAYLRAIEIQPDFGRPLYGLSVLYVFELNKPDKAVPLLEKLLTVEKRNLDAMFILARAYYSTGNSDGAIEMYDQILAQTKSDAHKTDAQANKDRILKEGYGKQ